MTPQLLERNCSNDSCSRTTPTFSPRSQGAGSTACVVSKFFNCFPWRTSHTRVMSVSKVAADLGLGLLVKLYEDFWKQGVRQLLIKGSNKFLAYCLKVTTCYM